MNFMKIFIFSSIIFLFFFTSCQPKKTDNVIIVKENQPELKSDSISKIEEYYFINASSGLNYRESPKGKVLGKFLLNSSIKVIEKTGIFEEIKDNNKIVKGEWFGVEKDHKKVYVFSAFLSGDYTFSDLKLLFVSPYYKNNQEEKSAFVNLSSFYFINYNEEIQAIISKEDLKKGKNKISFNKNQKQQILQKSNLSINDSLFIFNLDKDSIYKFSIANFPAVGYVDAYHSNDQELSIFDYEIGLDLGKIYSSQGQNLAYIGKANPFKIGQIKLLIWKKIANSNFPTVSKKETYSSLLDTYLFQLNNYSYYIQRHIHTETDNIRSYHLVITDTISKKIISENNYKSGESIDLTPLLTKNEKANYYNSYTGAIFKNKPPIIYGLESHSFGCPKIDFINSEEPSIEILCDNRH